MGGPASPWGPWSAVAYDLIAIPLLAALLFVMLIAPRAALKDRLGGTALIVASLGLALALLLSATWLVASAVPRIDVAAAMIRVCAAGLLLAAWLVPRELRG